MVSNTEKDIRKCKMRLSSTLAICSLILLTGCASKDYAVYVDAQKSLSKDSTMTETARLAALAEMAKSNDPAVRATGIMLLQQLQHGSKPVAIEPPKKNWLGL
jgi:hypothetical protein